MTADFHAWRERFGECAKLVLASAKTPKVAIQHATTLFQDVVDRLDAIVAKRTAKTGPWHGLKVPEFAFGAASIERDPRLDAALDLAAELDIPAAMLRDALASDASLDEIEGAFRRHAEEREAALAAAIAAAADAATDPPAGADDAAAAADDEPTFDDVGGGT